MSISIYTVCNKVFTLTYWAEEVPWQATTIVWVPIECGKETHPTVL